VSDPVTATLNIHLKRQIEFIRDTDRGPVHEVIVKVRSGEKEKSALLATVAEALRRRALSSSARDILPAASAATKSKPTPTAAGQSLVAWTRRAGVRSSNETLRNLGQEAVDSFVRSDVVRASRVPAKGDGPAMPEPVRFWSSQAAVLRIQGKDLEKVATEAASVVEEILPNQRLSVPPMVVPRRVPRDVEDNTVSSWGLRQIGALSTWGAFGGRGKGIRIGLLDTGVDDQHPDLEGKVISFAEFDKTGRQVKDAKAYDSDQHGTHCAGTICGGKASGRWIGVAPEAELAVGLVLNGRQGGSSAQILAGMEWAINQGVHVISMSLGGLTLVPEIENSPYTSAVISAVSHGIPVVTAIGNDGSQISGMPGNDFMAFSVGATDYNDKVADFSGGRTHIIRNSEFFPQDQLPIVYSKPEISAPGVAIWSSIPRNKHVYFNGTSMATPHVAGAIALLLSNININNAVAAEERAYLIQDLLTGSVEECGESGQNHRFGFGRLDILKAIGFARELGY
jgi:subtilisin family serine protease